MAGHALAISDAYPSAAIVGVEPEGADDFKKSVAAQRRIRLERPSSICDGLLSYDVGEHNWPILSRLVRHCVTVPDSTTQGAMKWWMDKHGVRTEPSGAITLAAVLGKKIDLNGDGDIVIVLSGRNVDPDTFDSFVAGASIS